MNSRYIKVEGHKNLLRDSITGAILNTNTPPKKSPVSHFNSMTNDINNLKEEISEIKLLLQKILDKHD
jgi:predicted transcriptional regulator